MNIGKPQQSNTPMPDKLPSAEGRAMDIVAYTRYQEAKSFYHDLQKTMTAQYGDIEKATIELLMQRDAAIRADEARIQSERYAACVEALKELIAGKDKHLFETWTETPADEEPTHVERCCRAIDLWSKARKALAELEGKGKI